MTWEELKEKAKEMGYSEIRTFYYDDDGYEVDSCALSNGLLTIYNDGRIVGSGLKPEQMLMIMRGLE